MESTATETKGRRARTNKWIFEFQSLDTTVETAKTQSVCVMERNNQPGSTGDGGAESPRARLPTALRPPDLYAPPSPTWLYPKASCDVQGRADPSTKVEMVFAKCTDSKSKLFEYLNI